MVVENWTTLLEVTVYVAVDLRTVLVRLDLVSSGTFYIPG